MRFQPADPGFQARVRASFGRQAALICRAGKRDTPGGQGA
jgi:hypothetical protein